MYIYVYSYMHICTLFFWFGWAVLLRLFTGILQRFFRVAKGLYKFLCFFLGSYRLRSERVHLSVCKGRMGYARQVLRGFGVSLIEGSFLCFGKVL